MPKIKKMPKEKSTKTPLYWTGQRWVNQAPPEEEPKPEEKGEVGPEEEEKEEEEV